jgi:hypothetical protein
MTVSGLGGVMWCVYVHLRGLAVVCSGLMALSEVLTPTGANGRTPTCLVL